MKNKYPIPATNIPTLNCLLQLQGNELVPLDICRIIDRWIYHNAPCPACGCLYNSHFLSCEAMDCKSGD